MSKKYDIADISLAPLGKNKIHWAAKSMQVLTLLGGKFAKTKTFKNITIGACLHVTSETANLVINLKKAGAKVFLCASNPLSTQDEVAASLVDDYDIPVFAIKGENTKVYYQHLNAVLDSHPQITLDDGADLVSMLHTKRISQAKEIIGSCEETTTGVIRLKAMEKDGSLKLPVFAVNDSDTKHLFDNRYGTGQSTIDGILRATNILFAGKVFVVCGYGWCGRGLAMRARGMGAHVVVTEVDPIKALEAVMDGYEVDRIDSIARRGDIFITLTGDKNVISFAHILKMKNGAILANSGHFNVEIALEKLEKEKESKRTVRPFVQEYVLKDGTVRYVLGEGRLINLAAAEGHPAEVMDMSFANQILAVDFLLKNKGKLQPKVYKIAENMDKEIARLKLQAMGINIDKLTNEQEKYLSTWKEGT